MSAPARRKNREEECLKQWRKSLSLFLQAEFCCYVVWQVLFVR
jgi:hypothetical protein